MSIRRSTEFIVITFNDIVLKHGSGLDLVERKNLLNSNFLHLITSDKMKKPIGFLSVEPSSYITMEAQIQKNIFYNFLQQLEADNKDYFQNLRFDLHIKKYKSTFGNHFQISSLEVVYSKILLKDHN